jgi:hypothetical protein
MINIYSLNFGSEYYTTTGCILERAAGVFKRIRSSEMMHCSAYMHSTHGVRLRDELELANLDMITIFIMN